jgi:hypothetical protein
MLNNQMVYRNVESPDAHQERARERIRERERELCSLRMIFNGIFWGTSFFTLYSSV